MWQENGRIVQIDTLYSFRCVSEHFGLYVFYGIECAEPEILYIGQSKLLINRLLQHFHCPTPGEQTGAFYTIYRNYWERREGTVGDARPYWKQYWRLLCRSKLIAMAWPIDNDTDEATSMQKKAIKAFENNLIWSFDPKYNNQRNSRVDLNEWYMQDKFDELSCELRQRREAMRGSGSAQGRAGGRTGNRT